MDKDTGQKKKVQDENTARNVLLKTEAV